MDTSLKLHFHANLFDLWLSVLPVLTCPVKGDPEHTNFENNQDLKVDKDVNNTRPSRAHRDRPSRIRVLNIPFSIFDPKYTNSSRARLHGLLHYC